MKISEFYKFNKNLFSSRIRRYIKPNHTQEFYNARHYYKARDKVRSSNLESAFPDKHFHPPNDNSSLPRRKSIPQHLRRA